MGTKNNPGKYDCYEKAGPDEPLFVLRAADPDAPYSVRMWATRHNIFHPDESEKTTEALRCADAMEAWKRSEGRA